MTQDDSWTYKLAIFIVNALVIAESVLMMALGTNPFFHAMERPTTAFICFMILQMAFLGGAVIFGCGTCIKKPSFIRANFVLFVLNAINYFVYAALFFANNHTQNALAAFLAALVALLGAVLCRGYLTLLTAKQLGEKLPSASPSFAYSHDTIRV